MTDGTEAKVLMGIVGAPHGVRGQLRVNAFTADPLALGDYGPLHDRNGNIYEFSELRRAKNVVVVTFKGVSSRAQAEALNGVELFIERERLPDDTLEEDEFFIADLVGLYTIDEGGTITGRVVAVHNFGADDMLEVKPAGGGRSALYPFTRAVIPDVDLTAGRLVLVPPGEIEIRPDAEEEP